MFLLTICRISSMRASRISTMIRCDTLRGLRSPTVGTSMMWFSLIIEASAPPYRYFSSSASCRGVRSPTDRSLVRLLPPSASSQVCLMVPLQKIARSVVPPPMSMSATPSSISSLLSTDSDEATDSSTISATASCARLQLVTTLCRAVTSAVTMCTLVTRRTPVMPSGFWMPVWSSTMYSWGRTWMICWLSEILTVCAAWMTASMSFSLISWLLMAMMPGELNPLMWLPAMPT